jgi:hypothetical protein
MSQGVTFLFTVENSVCSHPHCGVKFSVPTEQLSQNYVESELTNCLGSFDTKYIIKPEMLRFSKIAVLNFCEATMVILECNTGETSAGFTAPHHMLNKTKGR